MRRFVFLVLLAPAYFLMPGCVSNGAFNGFVADMGDRLDRIDASSAEFRVQHAEAREELERRVLGVVEQKAEGLISQEQAEAQFAALRSEADTHVEEIERAREAELREQYEQIQGSALEWKEKSEEDFKTAVNSLIEVGVGGLLQSPALASAATSAVSAAISGNAETLSGRVLQDQITDAILEQSGGSVSHEDAITYAGTGGAVASVLLHLYRNSTRKRTLQQVGHGQPAPGSAVGGAVPHIQEAAPTRYG